MKITIQKKSRKIINKPNAQIFYQFKLLSQSVQYQYESFNINILLYIH